MIQVNGLTKDYGARRAIDNLTFDAEQGEIVGFLGPNGAGKTTTMRILTGYMPPTDGTATVAGYDVVEESLGRACGEFLTPRSAHMRHWKVST